MVRYFVYDVEFNDIEKARAHAIRNLVRFKMVNFPTPIHTDKMDSRGNLKVIGTVTMAKKANEFQWDHDFVWTAGKLRRLIDKDTGKLIAVKKKSAPRKSGVKYKWRPYRNFEGSGWDLIVEGKEDIQGVIVKGYAGYSYFATYPVDRKYRGGGFADTLEEAKHKTLRDAGLI